MEIKFNKFFSIQLIFLFLSLIVSFNSIAQTYDSIKVLIVAAHPDDEVNFAVTVYKITHELKGKVDLCVITNGEGGYKYSTLAESWYGLELTDEKVGRENLPRIRKTEMMNAGKIIGIRNYFFLDQKDSHYGLDERDPLDTSWNILIVKSRLLQIMTSTKYDYVFCLLPTTGTHGGHKAAALLSLRTIKELPPAQRPIVLSGTTASKSDTSKTEFTQLNDYSETKVRNDIPLFVVDRSVKFGFKNALDYKTIVNWEIAEHKSQGTLNSFFNQGDYEQFWYYSLNPENGIEKTKQLFERLKVIPYPSKTY